MSGQILDFSPSVARKLPPHSIDAEMAVLGGILLDSGTLLQVVDFLDSEAFYLAAHAIVYRAILTLHYAGLPIDLMTVTAWLSDHDLLTAAGGRSNLAQLLNLTVSSVSVEPLATVVAEKAISRQMIVAGNQVANLGEDQAESLDSRLDMAEQKIFELRHKRREANKPELASEISLREFQRMEMVSQTGETPSIPCGFYDLDEMLGGGFYPEELIVVGGRPSMGKSLFAAEIAYEIAKTHQAPTLIFSLEMNKASIIRRYISKIAQVESGKLRRGNIEPIEWERVAAAVAELDTVPLLIDDTPCPSIPEIKSKVRAMTAQHGQLKLVAIDYLQLLVDGSSANLVQRLGEITRQLKLMARECNVPVMLLSQLNRGVEDRNNKRPMQSDLRDSGRIEEDADVILFPYRDEYYNPQTQDRGIMEVICTKQRNGRTGTIKLLFNGAFSQLRNLAMQNQD